MPPNNEMKLTRPAMVKRTRTLQLISGYADSRA